MQKNFTSRVGGQAQPPPLNTPLYECNIEVSSLMYYIALQYICYGIMLLLFVYYVFILFCCQSRRSPSLTENCFGALSS